MREKSLAIARELISYWQGVGVSAKHAMQALRPLRIPAKSSWIDVERVAASEWRKMMGAK